MLVPREVLFPCEVLVAVEEPAVLVTVAFEVVGLDETLVLFNSSAPLTTSIPTVVNKLPVNVTTG